MAESIYVTTDELAACAEQFKNIAEDLNAVCGQISAKMREYDTYWKGSFTKDFDKLISDFCKSSNTAYNGCINLADFINAAVEKYIQVDHGLIPQSEVNTNDYPSNVTVSPQGGVSPAQFQKLLEVLERYKNAQYVYGGTSTTAIDCSGLVMQAFKEAGIRTDFTHSALEIYNLCTPVGAYPKGGVDLSQLKPGDLVFYSNGGTDAIDHVGIYLGDGQVMAAANPSDGVVIKSIDWTRKSTIYVARV